MAIEEPVKDPREAGYFARNVTQEETTVPEAEADDGAARALQAPARRRRQATAVAPLWPPATGSTTPETAILEEARDGL